MDLSYCEVYSSIHGYDKFETLVNNDYHFLVAGTLKIEATISYKFSLFCHFKLLPPFAVAFAQ